MSQAVYATAKHTAHAGHQGVHTIPMCAAAASVAFKVNGPHSVASVNEAVGAHPAASVVMQPVHIDGDAFDWSRPR